MAVDKTPMSGANDPETDKLGRYKAWWRADREHSAPWRKMATEDFEFLAGDQWSDQDRASLKEQMRPVITFNRTNPIINAISGMEIQNRQEVKFFPREQGDQSADEVLTSAVEWFRDQSNGDDEDSDMFLDAVVCGLGGTETTMSFEDEEDGAPSISCMNPLELYWDHAARKKNYTDATRKWRVRQVPLSRAREMAENFANHDEGTKFSDSDLDAAWAAADDKEDPTDRERARLYADDGEKSVARDETMVTIVHLQHITRETVYMVTDPSTGKKAEVPVDDYLKLKERADMVGMQLIAQKQQVKKIRTCIIGAKVLLDTEALCPKDFSFQFVTAYIDRNTGLPYGMMRIMKDPQRWANKWMSQAMHILNTNAKGGVMVEEDAVEDVRDFERTWPRNDKVTVVAPGALSGGSPKIVPKSQPTMDGSFFNMMQFAIQSVRDVTGVSVELLGMREATQAASLEAQRKQAGITNLQPIFDNLKRYRRDEGKVMLYIIQKVIPKIDEMTPGSVPRLVRIVGDAGAQYVPLALKADARYDVIVDDQPTSPDRNMEVLRILAPYMQYMPPSVMLEMLDLLPVPTSVKEKIRAASQQEGQAQAASAQAQAEAAQQMQQMEQNKLSLEAEKLKAETRMKEIDAQMAMLGLEQERTKAAYEQARSQAEMQSKAAELQNSASGEAMKLDAEQQQKQAELQFKYDQLAQEKQLELIKLGMQQQQQEASVEAALTPAASKAGPGADQHPAVDHAAMLMNGLTALGEQNMAIAKMMAAPKTTTLSRDQSGRPVGATTTTAPVGG